MPFVVLYVYAHEFVSPFCPHSGFSSFGVYSNRVAIVFFLGAEIQNLPLCLGLLKLLGRWGSDFSALAQVEMDARAHVHMVLHRHSQSRINHYDAELWSSPF